MAMLSERVQQCWRCQRCYGYGYQIQPILFCGNYEAKILVIGQNPGEIDPNKHLDRAKWMHDSKIEEPDPQDIVGFYNWDFGTSYAAKTLARVFGDGWFRSFKYCYTNAVRCRTYHNATPSEEMLRECARYTVPMMEKRSLVVPIGRLAVTQVEKVGIIGKLKWGVPHVQVGWPVVFPIMHYSAWRGYKEDYREGFRSAIELAKLGSYLD